MKTGLNHDLSPPRDLFPPNETPPLSSFLRVIRTMISIRCDI